VEGILILSIKELVGLMDLKVFVVCIESQVRVIILRANRLYVLLISRTPRQIFAY
jgi:uridine kinase